MREVLGQDQPRSPEEELYGWPGFGKDHIIERLWKKLGDTGQPLPEYVNHRVAESYELVRHMAAGRDPKGDFYPVVPELQDLLLERAKEASRKVAAGIPLELEEVESLESAYAFYELALEDAKEYYEVN